MQCPLCSHPKAHKHGLMPNGHQRYFCPVCRQTFSSASIVQTIEAEVKPEQIRQVLQAHSEGSSWEHLSFVNS